MADPLLQNVGDIFVNNNLANRAPASAYAHLPQPGYDPLKYPADIEEAKNHGLASRIKKKLPPPDNTTFCPCCNEPIENEQIELCSDYPDIYHLGYCYPLYFQFIKYCVFLLIFCFLFTGIYCIYVSVSQVKNTQTQMSVINKVSLIPLLIAGLNGDNAEQSQVIEYLTYQAYLNLACIICMLIFFQIFKDSQTKMVWEAHHENITPGDYTVMLAGLEGLDYTQEEILDFLREGGFHDDLGQIRKVNITYNIDILITLSKDRLALYTKKAKLIQELAKLQIGTLEYEKVLNEKNAIELNIVQITEQIKNIESRKGAVDSPLQLSGTVFVTYNSHHQAKVVKKHYKKLWTHKLCVSTHKFKGYHVHAKRAPEPTDVYWENLHFSGWPLRCARIKSHIFTILLIIFSFIIVYFIDLYGDNKTGSMSAEVIAMVCSVLVVIINFIMNIVMRGLSESEKPKSYTHLNTSIAEKLTVAQFFNSALVTFFVQITYLETTTDGNSDINMLLTLAMDIFYIFCSNAFLTPILIYFDVTWYLKLYNQKQLEKANEKDITVAQYEANGIFEGPQIDMAQKYSNIVKTMFLTAFYAPMVPFGLVISTIGLILCYWADKVTLLRRNVTPLELGRELSKIMTDYLEFFPFLFATGNAFLALFVKYHLGDTHDADIILIICFIGWFLSILHLFIPTRHIHKAVTKREQKHKAKPSHKYDDLWLTFETDYDRINPLTRNEAELEFLRASLHIETDPKKREKFAKQIENLQNKNIDHIGNYTLMRPMFASQTRTSDQAAKMQFHKHCRECKNNNISSYGQPVYIQPGYVPPQEGITIEIQQPNVQIQHHHNGHHHNHLPSQNQNAGYNYQSSIIILFFVI